MSNFRRQKSLGLNGRCPYLFYSQGRLFLLILLTALLSVVAVGNVFAAPGVTPYSSDANTVLLDHFDGATSASVLAYSETGAPCGSPKPSATPNSAYGSGPNGLSQALSLNPPVGEPAGSGNYLQYPGGQLLSQSNGTIEFWTYLTTYGTGVGLVQQGPFPGACAGWTFGMSVSATGQLSAGAWAAFSMNSGATTVPLNTWTHVAATWGSTRAKLYINGVQVGSDANTGMPASGYGGSVLVNYGGGVSTQIDELRISNVQRTSFSIASPPTFALSVAKTGTGGGTVASSPAGISCGASCSASYDTQTIVTLTATPDATSSFAGWSGDADCSDGSVTMDADKTCTATFNLIQYTLTITPSGTGNGTVTDLVGIPHNGILINSPTWTTGRYNNGLSLSNGKYVSVPHDDIFNITGDLTISMWVKPDSITCSGPDPAYVLVSKRSSNIQEPYEFMIGCDGTLRYAAWGTNIVWPSAVSTGTITTGVWQHVAMTRSFSGITATVTFYINGVAAGSSSQDSGPTLTNSDPVWISRSGYFTGYTNEGSYSGLMDEVQIYNRAVSSSEITQIYNNSYSSVANIVGNWKLDETSGTTASDSAIQNKSLYFLSS